jgi:hypothetical protein
MARTLSPRSSARYHGTHRRGCRRASRAPPVVRGGRELGVSRGAPCRGAPTLRPASRSGRCSVSPRRQRATHTGDAPDGAGSVELGPPQAHVVGGQPTTNTTPHHHRVDPGPHAGGKHNGRRRPATACSGSISAPDAAGRVRRRRIVLSQRAARRRRRDDLIALQTDSVLAGLFGPILVGAGYGPGSCGA